MSIPDIIYKNLYDELVAGYKQYQALVWEITDIEKKVGKKRTVYGKNAKGMKAILDEFKVDLRMPDNINDEYIPEWILTKQYGFCMYDRLMNGLIEEREDRLNFLKYKFYLWNEPRYSEKIHPVLNNKVL